MKRTNRLWAILVMCLIASSAILSAQGDPLKQRFIQRKPKINALKNQGKIGENNHGLLDVRAPNVSDKDRAIVQAENADRLKVYQQIAGNVGSNANVVGKRRAAQIAQNAAPGHWLQDAEGNWYRKGN